MNNFTINGPFPSRKAYQVLRDRLIAYLIESGAAVGDDFCSDAQLMEKARLSRSTVRKAVDDLCNAGWVERRAGIGTFVGPRVALAHPPQPLANGKSAQDRETIRVAVLLHLQGEGGADFFTRGVLQGLDSAALEEGLSVELVGDSNMDLSSLAKRLARSRANVLVVMPSTARHALQAGIAEGMGIPCLVAGTHMFESGLPTVQEDGEQGVALAVRHLVERGHRRIGLWLSQAPAIWVHQRRNGYLNALRECGIEPDERSILWTPYTLVSETMAKTQHTNVEALDQYMKTCRPTALILGSSGQHTRTLGEWLRKSHVRVPEELSIISIDQNYEDYSHYLHRRPTVVALPLAEIGRNLARLARKAQEAKDEKTVTLAPLTVLPCTLIEGDSVASHTL